MRTSLRATMTLTTASALLAVASVAAGGLAAAKPIDRGTIHEDLSFVLNDFCGVAGLDIDFDAAIDFEYTVRSKGSTQLPYFSQFVMGTRTFTNPDNDRYVTEVFHGIEKDCGSPTTATELPRSSCSRPATAPSTGWTAKRSRATPGRSATRS